MSDYLPTHNLLLLCLNVCLKQMQWKECQKVVYLQIFFAPCILYNWVKPGLLFRTEFSIVIITSSYDKFFDTLLVWIMYQLGPISIIIKLFQ